MDQQWTRLSRNGWIATALLLPLIEGGFAAAGFAQGAGVKPSDDAASAPQEHDEAHGHEMQQGESRTATTRPDGMQSGEMDHGDMREDVLGIPHAREASGTSWQPDSTPMHAFHFAHEEWMLMFHANVFAGYDFQSSQRGDDQWFSTNWLMLMAQRPIGEGQLGLRSMLSLEPATVGRDGYPLLLQTGESLGDERLHDSQHAHDLFMEVAATWTQPITHDLGLQVYAAPAGEPALGPTAFPHRMSASSDPFAPLGHHWQDSTHISFGVLTGGLFTKYAKLEGSWFNGREPDENRWDFDLRTPDSWSTRITINPTEFLSAQVSAGYLESPEALEPDQSVQRTTASITANCPWGEEGNWATTLVWGRNKPESDTGTSSFLLETNWELDRHHVPFGRIEYVRKSGEDLELPLSQQNGLFPVTSFSLGYLYNFEPLNEWVPSIGARVTYDLIGSELESTYGEHNPYGFAIFLRLRPAASRPSGSSRHGQH